MLKLLSEIIFTSVICTNSAQGIKSKHPIHRSSYGLWLTFVWPSSAGRRMTPLEHCPAGTWLPPPRTCVPFSSARPPSNEWWPGLFLWQHQAKTKGHIHHCFHLSSGDNFYNFYFTNQKLFQGVISEDKNLFKYYNTNFCKILGNIFFFGGGERG